MHPRIINVKVVAKLKRYFRSINVKVVAKLKRYFRSITINVKVVAKSKRYFRSINVKVCCKINQRLSRACIVHLVIKRTNWSYVKTMSRSGSHLGISINIKNTKFVKDLPMIDAQFRFNQCNSFREENISVYSHMVLC